MGLGENELFRIEKAEQIAPSDMPLSHVHNYYEIYYLLSGSRRYFINRTIYNVSAGDVVFVSKGDLHMTSALTSNHHHERILITFSSEFLNIPDSGIKKEEFLKCFSSQKLQIAPPQRYAFENLLNKALSEFNKNDEFSYFLAKNCVFEILAFLNRYSKMKVTPSDDVPVHEKKMQNICKYICDNYSQPITLNEVAKMAYMNPTYFSRKFKKVTGLGFNEYLNNVRIKAASAMLTETKYSVTEIAYLCGYKDSNYFGDVFKKIKGISPSKYRKINSSI